MEELRKKDLKSIVAQRLILFNALESARPRTDDGSPLPLNDHSFIFNKSLSPEIITDIKNNRTGLKSINSRSIVGQASSLHPIYENCSQAFNMATRQQDGDVQPSYSVKHLRSLFETSSVPLTARNSLERQKKTKPNESPDLRRNRTPLPQKGKEKDNVKSESSTGNVGASVCEEMLMSSLKIVESVTLQDTPSVDDDVRGTTKQGASLPTSTLEECPESSEKENDVSQARSNDVEITKCEILSSSLDQASSQQTEESVEKESIMEHSASEVKDDVETENKEERPSVVTSSVRSSNQRTAENMRSVYVEPTFKVTNDDSKPSNVAKPIKQRTLGRGDIKPYEIVDLVEKAENEAKPSRMESMYVQTFGGKTSDLDKDGYQTIPEYNEPDSTPNDTLESNEFNLSNLAMNESFSNENNDSPSGCEQALHEHRSKENRNQKKELHLSKLSSLPTSLNESLNGSSVSTSVYSDYGEGWDSDEFDDFTDDDVLEDSRPRAKTVDGDNTKKKIYNIVSEILTTEKAYEKRLHLLDQIFQARLMKEAKENSNIPEKVIQEIFSNLSSIYIFHSTMLLPDLEKRIANWTSNEKIGDIFKTLGHCLKLYTDYVKNFDHATTTLSQWMKKSAKFASIIEEIQRMPECENLNLQHHMLEPIQRVPRYKLLLQDYLKKLPKDAADRSEAEESLVVISEAADHANNSMKGMDKFKRLLELEERIVEGLRGESLATPSRVFLKEGELVKIAARSDQKNIRVLLLFNDLLLCCSKVPPTGKLKVKQMMDVPGMTLQDGCDVDLGEAHSFRVKSRQRVLDLAAVSDEEKSEWFSAISGVIAEYEAKRGTLLKQFMEEDARKEAQRAGSMKIGQAAPVWVKDEDVTMCMLCAVRFSILIRRHHCRACGRIVCDNCSKYKANLSYNNMVKRVCYVCHRKLNIDKIQETNSFILKKTTIDRVARDPKRRRSTIVSEINGDLLWKPPGKGWHKGWFAISDLVLYAHKGKRDPKAQMTIALPGYSVNRATASDEVDEAKHPYAFKVHFGNKKEMTYFFEAESEERMQRWIDVIRYSIKAEKPPPLSKTL